MLLLTQTNACRFQHLNNIPKTKINLFRRFAKLICKQFTLFHSPELTTSISYSNCDHFFFIFCFSTQIQSKLVTHSMFCMANQPIARPTENKKKHFSFASESFQCFKLSDYHARKSLQNFQNCK